MSAIFGFVHLDGEPVAAPDLPAMDAALAAWGPDGGGTWSEGSCGLGHRLLHNTPESLFEKMPLRGRGGGVVLVAAARLDNRDELFGALGVPTTEQATTTDGELILRSYERWGEESPSRLLGDWAFAAWDRESRSLFLARDQLGHTALYYHSAPGFFAFASGHAGLFALPRVPRRLDDLHIAEVLSGWPGDGTATMWEKVKRLPPAHCLTVSARKVALREYWHPRHAPLPQPASDDEYVERFLELYSEAVRCRLRSLRPVGSTLSAGLDSSSVTALAARELRRQGRSLVAFTSAPYEPPTSLDGADSPLLDEWPLAREAAEFIGVAEHVKVSSSNSAEPLDALQRALRIHSEPAPAALSHYWVHSMLAQARDRGLGTLLVGQMGNATVSWAGSNLALAHRAVTGGWPAVWRELMHERRTCGDSLGRVAWRRLLRPAILAARGQLQWRFQEPQTEWVRRMPLNPDLRTRSGIAQHMRRTEPRIRWFSARTSLDERLAVLMPGVNAAGAFLHEIGAHFGLELRDPTADIRLVEFCLGVPEDQYSRNGHRRWLIRRAVEGLLPPSVQWNTRRGMQSGDMARLALGDLDRIGQAVARVESSPVAMHYLSLPLLRRLWADVRQPDSAEAAQSVYYLFGILQVGMFLIREENEAAELRRSRTGPTGVTRELA